MIDFGLILLLAITMIIGYRNGFIWQLLKLLRLILILGIIYFFGNQITLWLLPIVKPYVIDFLSRSVGVAENLQDQVAVFVIRLLLPCIVILVITFFTKQVISLFHGKIIKNIPVVGMFNSLLGGLLAGVQCVSLFLLVVALFPSVGNDWELYMSQHSVLVGIAKTQLPEILKLLQMYW